MKSNTKSTLLWQALAMTAILVLLSACGGEASNLGAAEERIEITDSDASQTIDRSRPYELIISGSGKTIIVATNNQITQLTISGDTNIVTVSSGTTIDSLTFTGSGNTVTKLSGSVITTVVDQTKSNFVISG